MPGARRLKSLKDSYANDSPAVRYALGKARPPAH